MADEFTGWRKSARSIGNGECVEVGTGPAVVGIRDTRLRDASPVLKFSAASWAAFTAGLKTA